MDSMEQDLPSEVAETVVSHTRNLFRNATKALDSTPTAAMKGGNVTARPLFARDEGGEA